MQQTLEERVVGGGDENKYTLVYYAKRNEVATELYYDLPSDSV